MRKIIVISAFVISIFHFSLPAQDYNFFCRQAEVLTSLIKKNHYDPREINDSLSHDVYKVFLKMLDPYSIYFLQSDVQSLSIYRSELDDELRNGSCSFLNAVSGLYLSRLLQCDTLVGSLLQKPYVFSDRDTLAFAKTDSLNFATDSAALVLRWNKWLKYRILLRMVSQFYENDSLYQGDISRILQKEPDIRNNVRMREQHIIRRIINYSDGYENYLALLYNNAIASCFDPHTMFFSQKEKESFESSISKESYSYGIDIDEDRNGNVFISRLVPGGPAWKSNELHKGDVLVRMHQQDGEPIDLSFLDADEVADLFSSADKGYLDLTVRKASGVLKTVRLIREKVRQDENNIKCFLLKGEKNIGYISLPGFYTEWENENNAGCANDIAREIIKLKKENIGALILDLRFNGGGSMNEAINLAGIFVDAGPLCIYSLQDKKPVSLKDMNRGMAYDGPLLIMVNGLSASASEVVAGALQDYNRALIVGSPTYGKASGQAILSLDTNANVFKADHPGIEQGMGYSKITVGKLYRITGVSYQRKGIIPDISFPDPQYNDNYREAATPFALYSDTVNKKVYYTPWAQLPKQELTEKSKQRMEQDERFQRIKEITDSLQAFFNENKKYPLEPVSFFHALNKPALLWKSLEKLSIHPTSLFSVNNTLYDMEIIRMEPYFKEINDLLLKDISEDIYIEESYRILNDMLDNTK